MLINMPSFGPNHQWNSVQPLVDCFVYQLLVDLYSSSSTRRRDVFRFKSFLTMCRTELCDIPVSRAISLGLLVRSWLTFLATNELFDRLNVFVCSRTARTTAARSSVSWTSFVNFSNKIVQRSFLPLSLRKFTHHLKSIPTFFQSQTFYQTPVFCR